MWKAVVEVPELLWARELQVGSQLQRVSVNRIFYRRRIGGNSHGCAVHVSIHATWISMISQSYKLVVSFAVHSNLVSIKKKIETKLLKLQQLKHQKVVK